MQTLRGRRRGQLRAPFNQKRHRYHSYFRRAERRQKLASGNRQHQKYKGICECAMSYTVSPVHTTEYFVNLAETLANMGADIICIKDMANLLLPYTAYELVSEIKKKVGIPVHIHTHNTCGTGDMVNLKAIEAGADIVDTALSPLGNGTSQPATEPLVATLQGTPYDTGIDLEVLSEASDYFRKVADRLKADGFLSDKVLKVNIKALMYQVPGGMLSNLINQLKEQNASDKYQEVLEEVPRVRKIWDTRRSLRPQARSSARKPS
ncbi:MAG: hypothetical protein L6V82_08420 [Clostridiales bacterium]|nr:MAG: hypothetical protein L6V82_08420 [Clostridiales bacterium]